MGRFSLKKLNNEEGNEQSKFKLSNRSETLKSLGSVVG
jgi:hypothetical protein